MYLLIVDKEYDEWEENSILGRKRKWFNLFEAKTELDKHKPIQGTYLNLLKGYESNASFSDVDKNFSKNKSVNHNEFDSFSSNLSHQYSSLMTNFSVNFLYNPVVRSDHMEKLSSSSPCLLNASGNMIASSSSPNN